MINLYRLFLFLLFAAMMACASVREQVSKEIRLVEPALLGQAVQVSQQVEIHWQEKNHQLMVVWSQQDGLLQVVGLSAAGQQLFRASFNGQDYQQQIFVAALAQLNLRQLLRHIQIAYWPEASVVALLRGDGEQIVIEPAHRIVSRSGVLVARYAFKNQENFSSVLISAPQQPSLTVTTLTVQVLSSAEAAQQGVMRCCELQDFLTQEHAG